MNHLRSLSVSVLLAVAVNASTPDYPRNNLLLEALAALRADRADLARQLGVSLSTINAWLAPGSDRAMPWPAVLRLRQLLVETAETVASSAGTDPGVTGPDWAIRQKNFTASQKFARDVAIRGKEE